MSTGRVHAGLCMKILMCVYSSSTPFFTFYLCAIIMQFVLIVLFLFSPLKCGLNYVFHNNQAMVYAANSDDPVEGRYFVKTVAVILYPSMSIYFTDDKAISNARQVSNNDILSKHSSCRCCHCPCQVDHWN